MRTTLKMVVPLIVSVAAGCLLFAAYQVNTQRRILRSDLSHRAEILGASLRDSVEPLLGPTPEGNIQQVIERFSQRENLKGIAVYDASGSVLAATFRPCISTPISTCGCCPCRQSWPWLR